LDIVLPGRKLGDTVMKWRTWMILVSMAVIAAGGAGAEPTTRPAGEVEKLLDKLQAAGVKYTALSAEVEYVEEEVLFADRTAYTGKVYYQKDPAAKGPARFRIHFDTAKQGRVKTKEDRDYVFLTNAKGQWFITRNARTKQFSEYHVAPPGASVDPLKLGKGPFPVPFGQDKADVLKLFEASTRKRTSKDPKGTSYLKLIPRPKAKADLKVRKIEIWVNADDGLPVKIRTEDADGQVIKTATFRKLDKDPKLTDKTFRLPPPPDDWEYQVVPLPKKRPAPK